MTTTTTQEQLEGLGTYRFGWADSDVAGASARRGLSEEVVRDISARKNEPEWMLDLRLKGLKYYGRKPLHRRAEQPAERLGFRLAQLRELGRHVRDRAVVLAELLAAFSLADRGRRARRGGVAVGGQRLGQRLDPGRELALGHHRCVPALQVSQLPAGELGDRLRTCRFGQEPQRARGQVIVGVLECAPPGVGDDEDLGRPAPAPVPVGPGRPGLDEPFGQEVVQVAPDGRRGEPEPAAQRRGGRWPEFQDQPRDLALGGAVS